MKKSGVENFNGLIRKIYPKGFDFSTISQDEIDNEIKTLNYTSLIIMLD